MAEDRFARADAQYGRPRTMQFTIVPDDAADIEPYLPSAIWVESTNIDDLVTVAFIDAEGNEGTITVPAFTLIHWIRMRRILATGTTATAIRGYP